MVELGDSPASDSIRAAFEERWTAAEPITPKAPPTDSTHAAADADASEQAAVNGG
jgi:hypothetical protein